MRTRIFLLSLIIVIVLFIIPPLHAQDSPSSLCESFGIQRFQEKKAALPFSLKDLDSNPVALSDFKGDPVLLFFWATWCGSCKEDIVLLEKFAEGKQGQLQILTLVIDGESERRVRRVVKKYKITVPVLLDRNEKIARAYGITMVPTVFLINREGFIEGKIAGQRAWDEPLAFTAVKQLLNLR